MHKLVVLCVVAVCRAGILPAPAVETDLELTAADADAGNWTANLGDMQINIEHKHAGEVQNASGTWILDISRTTFQKKENSDKEFSQEAKEETEILNSKAPEEAHDQSENSDQDNQIDNNEMDNEIPHDEERVDKAPVHFPEQQIPLFHNKYPQPVTGGGGLYSGFQPWMYGRPNFLYEMLPPKEEPIPETEAPETEEPFSATEEPQSLKDIAYPTPYYIFPDYPMDLVTPMDPDLVEKSRDDIWYPDEGAMDPDGFEHFRGVGWFKLDDRHMTWGEARDACAEVGAHLAVPDSQERVKVFLKLFQQHPDVPAEAILRDQVYVGVNDPDNNRQFTTVQGKPFNPGFPIWFVNEPDNAAPGESCVTFHVQGRTRDVPCSFSLPFFCEKDVPVVI